MATARVASSIPNIDLWSVPLLWAGPLALAGVGVRALRVGGGLLHGCGQYIILVYDVAY